MCTHPKISIVSEGCFLLCSRCGHVLDKRIIYHTSHNQQLMQTLKTPYDRRKRFNRLLANCFGSRCSVIPEDLHVYLLSKKPRTTEDIYKYIRESKKKSHKRYDALALLSIIFLGEKITPLPESITKSADLLFILVQERHHILNDTFPCYSWIIEKILRKNNRVDLLKFVNRLKCTRRRWYYERDYGHIFNSSIQASPVYCQKLVSQTVRHTVDIGVEDAQSLKDLDQTPTPRLPAFSLASCSPTEMLEACHRMRQKV